MPRRYEAKWLRFSRYTPFNCGIEDFLETKGTSTVCWWHFYSDAMRSESRTWWKYSAFQSSEVNSLSPWQRCIFDPVILGTVYILSPAVGFTYQMVLAEVLKGLRDPRWCSLWNVLVALRTISTRKYRSLRYLDRRRNNHNNNKIYRSTVFRFSVFIIISYRSYRA